MSQRNTAIRGLQILDAFFGDGLKRNSVDSNIAEVALKADKGLEFDANEVAVKIEANKGLSVGADGLATVLEANQGLSVGASGLAVDYDDDTIAIDAANKLAVKLATAAAPATDGYVVYWNDSASSLDLKEIATADNAIVEAEILLEDKTGEVDGIKTAFTLAQTPVVNSVQVYLNGLLQQEGSGLDYVLDGTTVTFADVPESGDLLLIHYIQKSST